MKKKNIREGGIVQFWNTWAEGGQIDFQKLGSYIMNPPPKERSIPTSAARAEHKKAVTDNEGLKEIPFNRNYKIYSNGKN